MHYRSFVMACASVFFLNTSLVAVNEDSFQESFLEIMIPEEEISSKIVEVAALLNQEYQNKEFVVIGVLKGSVCLVADLIRELKGPFNVEFIRCSSYGARGHVRGELTVTGLDHLQLEGKNVLIVDDIFDSGTTLTTVMNKVLEKNPSQVKSLVLLSKKVPRTVVYQPDYVLFEIEDYFAVGYGVDYKECFRGLKGIYNIHLEKMPKPLYGLSSSKSGNPE